MFGQVDTYVDPLDRIRDAYQRSSPPKLKVEIPHAGHFAFSDGCFPSPDCNPPTTLTQSESHAIVLRWVVPFLQRYLGGDASYEPLLNSIPPGVEVVQDR
jgi:hypothetical protein